jgi:DNA polymerase I-like protein with 3'-5' exonuclease and polymerase domains
VWSGTSDLTVQDIFFLNFFHISFVYLILIQKQILPLPFSHIYKKIKKIKTTIFTIKNEEFFILICDQLQHTIYDNINFNLKAILDKMQKNRSTQNNSMLLCSKDHSQ